MNRRWGGNRDSLPTFTCPAACDIIPFAAGSRVPAGSYVMKVKVILHPEEEGGY